MQFNAVIESLGALSQPSADRPVASGGQPANGAVPHREQMEKPAHGNDWSWGGQRGLGA